MIIKIDKTTEEKLRATQKSISAKTGIKPHNISLMVQVLLKWELDTIKESTLHELAPHMLTLAQQRKAVVSEMLAFKEKLDPSQLRHMMKTLEKLKQNSLKSEAISSENTA